MLARVLSWLGLLARADADEDVEIPVLPSHKSLTSPNVSDQYA